MFRIIAFVNGIYDVTCAMCILKYFNIYYFGNIHLSIIQMEEQKTPLYERSLGFFILSYGIMRMYGNIDLISFSYLLELMYYMNELNHNTVVVYKSLFTIFTCFIIWVYTRIFYVDSVII